MALPENYDVEVVTGKYLNLDGTPAVGKVTFTPQLSTGSFLTDAGAVVTIVPAAFAATLDDTGAFSISLPATNDTDIQPSGWTYKVSEQFTGTNANSRTYSITLAVGEGPVDLSTKAPAVAVVGSIVMVKSVNGILPDSTGNITITGGGGGGGGGSVSSVNNVTPDGSGNVALNAANVGALSQTTGDARYQQLSDDTFVGQFWKVGPTTYAFTPVGSQSAYLIVDKGASADDASLLLRDQGAIRAEIGLTTSEGNLHIKSVIGAAGSETFLDALIIENATGYVYLPQRLGIGTIPTELLHVAGSAPGARVLGKIENTDGNGAGFLLGGSAGSSWGVLTDVGENNGNNFGIFDNTAGYPPRLMIDSTGRVIIGSDTATTASANSLDVVGSVNTRGVGGNLGLNFCGRSGTVGPPTTGTWAVDDAVMDSTGAWNFCSAAGSPGTWVKGPTSSTLTPTAVKTSAYTAAAGDYVPVDISAGNVTITLPNAPADKTKIAVQAVTVSGSNTVTVAAAGTDVFNKTGGATTLSLAAAGQGITLQYAATPKIWYVQQGMQGATGATGAAGARGSQWFGGAGAPGTITGSAPRDWYLDENTGDIYLAS